MIVFDLACAQGHVFEAWFGSSDDYENQRVRGLVSCPLCGAVEVSKAVMAPNVSPKGNAATSPVPVQNGPAPAEMKAMLTALAKMQAKALANSEHVGQRFAEEARAIHDGDAPDRQIHGQATREEAKALIDDGIAVTPLPLPIAPPETQH
ncbi:DUF1178 family protein [Sphingomonas sp.]|uniref:DUF1178 family protein n=1 Tax=Sphingomonas sp. TaxID=28214 RepID=UPI003B3A6217